MSTTQQPDALRLADAVLTHTMSILASTSITAWPRQHARIAELEKDAARLLYATKDCDGFFHVMRDKHECTLECMEEAGRSEPTIEDELNGVRRLIDAAIATQAKKGV